MRRPGPGRPRLSAEEHKANGTYRPSRHGPLGADEPPAEGGLPLKVPAGLTGRAAEVRDELLAILGPMVRPQSVCVLVELCRWVERSERIAANLDAMDVTNKLFKSLLVSAAIAADKVDRLSARFGLSPADYSKVRTADPTPAKPKVKSRPSTSLDKQGAPT